MPIPRRNNWRPNGFCIFPGYHWCGPGCSGPGEPVDAVDAACKAHDMCYRRPGTSHTVCDQQLMQRLRPLMRQNNRQGQNARKLYNLMRLKRMFS